MFPIITGPQERWLTPRQEHTSQPILQVGSKVCWSLMPSFSEAFFHSVTNLMWPLPQIPIHVIIKICKCSPWQHSTLGNEASTSGSPLPVRLCLGPQISGIGDWGFWNFVSMSVISNAYLSQETFSGCALYEFKRQSPFQRICKWAYAWWLCSCLVLVGRDSEWLYAFL